MREHVTKQSTQIRIFFFNGLKLLPIGLMFGMLVPLSSTYSISPRINNNNFHLGFLRKTKEKEDEREKEERDGFEERERPGRV